MSSEPALLAPEIPLDGALGAGEFSLLTHNILLPNEGGGWWVFKFYQPAVPDDCRTWAHRKRLLREGLEAARADIVCLQETTAETFDADLGFLGEAGYEHALHRKGEIRCATFWKKSRFVLAAEPQHKDRTLLTSLRALDGSGRCVHVVNVHLKAGPDPARRLRQVHEALEQAQKELKKQVGSGPASIVVCGDFNSEPEGSAVGHLLREGVVQPGLREAAYPGQELTSKPRNQPFGPFGDAYSRAYGEGKAPASLLLPGYEGFFLDAEGALLPAVAAAIGAMFRRFAGGRGEMDRAAVEAWISLINRAPGRGSEWDKALAVFERAGAERLLESDLVAIYEAELREGKPWGVFHDLHACGVAPEGKLGVFEGRFDQIHYTTRTLELRAVRRPLTAEQERRIREQGDVLPNAWHPSDHLPMAAIFRWSEAASG